MWTAETPYVLIVSCQQPIELSSIYGNLAWGSACPRFQVLLIIGELRNYQNFRSDLIPSNNLEIHSASQNRRIGSSSFLGTKVIVCPTASGLQWYWCGDVHVLGIYSATGLVAWLIEVPVQEQVYNLSTIHSRLSHRQPYMAQRIFSMIYVFRKEQRWCTSASFESIAVQISAKGFLQCYYAVKCGKWPSAGWSD